MICTFRVTTLNLKLSDSFKTSIKHMEVLDI